MWGQSIKCFKYDNLKTTIDSESVECRKKYLEKVVARCIQKIMEKKCVRGFFFFRNFFVVADIYGMCSMPEGSLKIKYFFPAVFLYTNFVVASHVHAAFAPYRQNKSTLSKPTPFFFAQINIYKKLKKKMRVFSFVSMDTTEKNIKGEKIATEKYERKRKKILEKKYKKQKKKMKSKLKRKPHSFFFSFIQFLFLHKITIYNECF